jgi:hypothetical protein
MHYMQMEIILFLLVLAFIVGVQFVLTKVSPHNRLIISLIACIILMVWIWAFLQPLVSPYKIIITVVVLTGVYRNWRSYAQRTNQPGQ